MCIRDSRKGDRDLMACYHDGKDYVLEVLDHNVGPANTRVYKKPGNKLGILSTNREDVYKRQDVANAITIPEEKDNQLQKAVEILTEK